MIRPRCFALAVLLLLPLVASGAEIRGVISRFDPVRKELVLDARGIGIRGTILTLTVADNAVVTVNQKPATMANLAPGQRVHVVYELSNGKLLASSIQVGGLLDKLGNLLQTVPGTIPPPGQPPPRQLPVPAPPGAAPAGAGDSLTGTLRRVAYTEREIILATSTEGGEKYTVLDVPETAKVFRDGKPIPFDDLKEGEQAVVRAEKRDRKAEAVSISVGQPAAAPPAEGAPPAAGRPPPIPPGEALPPSTSPLTQMRRFLQMADKLLEELERRQSKR